MAFDINNTNTTVDLIAVGTGKITDTATPATVALTDLGAAGGHLAPDTYNLMTYATSTPLSAFTFVGGSTVQQAGMGYSYTLNTTSTALPLVSAANSSSTGNFYWTGLRDSNWSTLQNPSNASNWATTVTGTIDTLSVPGSTSNVFFTANTAVGVSGIDHVHRGRGLHDQ